MANATEKLALIAVNTASPRVSSPAAVARSRCDYLMSRPPLDLVLSEETQSRLPVIDGGVTFALAHLFKIIDPRLRNPQSAQWERAFSIFALLL